MARGQEAIHLRDLSREPRVVKSSAIGRHSNRELTGVCVSRRERRDGFVSDLRLLELARLRLGELWDSERSNGLFVAAVPPGVGCSSPDDRALARSLFLGVVLFFRPQQRVRFYERQIKLKDIRGGPMGKTSSPLVHPSVESTSRPLVSTRSQNL